VDVGMLVSPVLAEAIEQMAKAAEVSYKLMGDETDRETPDDSEIALAMMEAAKSKGESMTEEPVQEAEVVEEPQPTGLMARRT
jgi:hypothetical protein